MMAKKGCVTLNRWEKLKETEGEREGNVSENALAFAYIPGEVAQGKELSALFSCSPPYGLTVEESTEPIPPGGLFLQHC